MSKYCKCGNFQLSNLEDLPSHIKEILERSSDGIEREGGNENVGMYRPRCVCGILRPATVEQVQQIIEAFNIPGISCGLHPLSLGRNWGLGSREPATDHVVTLDLGSLRNVRAVDLDAGWALVEPGVTQGELANLLVGTSRMLNVTAASSETSVIGNCLDRGIGLRNQKVDDLAGLEIVLPSGKVIHAGWWPESERATAVYAHGLGPSLMPLFVQSNLGVVTAAAIRLLPRPEAQRILRLSFETRNLPKATSELRRWVNQGLVGGVLKVYDPVAAESYGGHRGKFLAHICIEGTHRSIHANFQTLMEEIDESGAFFKVIELRNEPSSSQDVIASMLQKAYAGDPGSNDAMLQFTLGQEAARIDSGGTGFRFFMAMIPFSAESVARAQQILNEIYTETGLKAGSTINVFSGDLAALVVSVKFDRRATDAANHFSDRAYDHFSRAGFMPFRIDVDHANWTTGLSRDLGTREFCRQLKEFIDPNGVIAPGRYA